MRKIVCFLITMTILSCSQEEFNIPNNNQADAERVLANATDFQNFNISNHSALFDNQIEFQGIYFRALADQFSTTNAFRGFWDFCDQPRRQVINSTANDDLGLQAGGPWNGFNSVINNANIVIDNIENNDGQVIVDEVDLTDQELAAAYFDKGVAQGYLALIYDKAYIVNPDTDPGALEFSTYQEVFEAGVDNIEKGLQLAQSVAEFTYQVYPGGQILDEMMFEQLANSYLARLSIGLPRTNTEASSLDYNAIINYASNGISEDFSPEATESVFFNNLQDWSLFLLSDGAGYMPSDQKIPHLVDPTYDTDYPTDETIILDPAIDNGDPRFEEYYEYVGELFGFLRASRGRYLFSSYRTKKFYNGNDQNQTGLPTNIMAAAEMQYIIAECHYRLGNYDAAVAVLDSSPRGTVGNQSTTAAGPNVLNALLYEVSIELDLASGICVEWWFMRRHDMLQAGSPTMYPVPASELEISQDEIYTFGGPAAAGETGTASGDNDWRNIDLVY
ncbi:RagB/SusD family nutrient uptake outer membrane protein [Muricauda sp. 2012CJ35-5]|uniref:RagB/SusD family nutrient uptake outer membrane protein n=1 Tax=Flagellimonas spongiicola TaxID=2942208 RepID=A0ABT0PR29_9FLAO|nr:RagB/SusD family nutrient uptake outer membrane protein [Allomuricauda spongiicola]MCL6273833.1 RagB/SusD family nutrient uptake outer membrane protein [Allomuricauda spongiicola]